MNKYILGAVVVAVVVIAGAISFSNVPTTVAPTVASTLTVDTTTHAFGDIDIFGGKVQTDYMVKNEGTEDITILSAVTSCICTEGEIEGLTFGMHESTGETVVIPAGGEKVLTATYDPLAHGPEGVGKVKRELFLKTNSTATPEVRVTFTANVVKSAG